jgi:hypothetical protein
MTKATEGGKMSFRKGRSKALHAPLVGAFVYRRIGRRFEFLFPARHHADDGALKFARTTETTERHGR